MFTALLVTALVVVFGSAAFVVARGNRGALSGRQQKQLPATNASGNLLERTVRDLRVGDIVSYEGRDYLVEGAVNYDEAGHRWTAGRLVDSGDEKWLIVGMEKAGADTVRLTEITDIDVNGYPPETMMAGGTRYNLDARGTATAKASGQTDVISGQGLAAESVQRCRWWRYEGAGGKCLILEQWGDAFRSLRGETIRISDLEMMPGS